MDRGEILEGLRRTIDTRKEPRTYYSPTLLMQDSETVGRREQEVGERTTSETVTAVIILTSDTRKDWGVY